VGVDPASDGLARAKRLGVATTDQGIDGLVKLPVFKDIRIAFDATSAGAHAHNNEVLQRHGVQVIDLTPAAIGPYVIPVVNLRERFGFPPVAFDEATRIVVSEISGQTVGFVVDGVAEVLRISDETIEAAPEATAGVDSSFIRGIGKMGERLVIVLDLERVSDFTAVRSAAE
jgi:acetaldehyde dehydrogenase (acetylating)